MQMDATHPADFVDKCSYSDDESVDDPRECCSDESDLASTGPASGPQTPNKHSSRAYHSWSKEESALLEALVHEHGCYRKWTLIAKHLPGRTGKQCRDRWNNHLRPGLKQGSWSAEEDYVLAYWHSKRGGSWAAIAFWLPGRTAVAIKNHWNAVNKLSEKGGKDTVLTTYVGLLRVGENREQAFSQSVKKIGLPAEWSAVLDQTLEASKYDNQASLLPPKWEEILRSNASAKTLHTHGIAPSYADQVSNRMSEQAMHDRRHTILHPYAAPAAAHHTVCMPPPASTRPTLKPRLAPSHSTLLQSKPSFAPLEPADCSSPSSGSSETEHSMLLKAHFDHIPHHLPSLSQPRSRTSSPSTTPSEATTTTLTPRDLPHTMDYHRSDPRAAPLHSQRASTRHPQYSSSIVVDGRGRGGGVGCSQSGPTTIDYDAANPADYMYPQTSHATASWSLPAESSRYGHGYRADCDLDLHHLSNYRTQYSNAYASQYAPQQASSRTSNAQGLYPPTATEDYDLPHPLSYPYADDLLDQLLLQQGGLLADDFAALDTYSLQSEQLRLEQLRKQLREHILSERKRRFSQAFTELDLPAHSPRGWGGHYAQPSSGHGYAAHREPLSMDFLESALKHESLV